MRNSVIDSTATIYRPECVEGRWYVKNLRTGKVSDTLSFPVEILTEMHCATLMGLRVVEARVLWGILDDLAEDGEPSADEIEETNEIEAIAV